MNAEDVIPVLMVRNEERFIARVLAPLVAVFPRVLVGDTGSTDSTLAEVARFPSVYLVHFGFVGQAQLTATRQELGLRAAQMGAPWQLLVDGDELYNVTTLRHMLSVELPAGTETGFTTMISLDEDDDPPHQMWELSDKFSRQCLLRAGCRWFGIYPFDSPDSFDFPQGFYYFPLPDGYRYHALHLHPLVRSHRDDETLLRTYKRRKFSLQDKVVPRAAPFDMESWCQQ